MTRVLAFPLNDVMSVIGCRIAWLLTARWWWRSRCMSGKLRAREFVRNKRMLGPPESNPWTNGKTLQNETGCFHGVFGGFYVLGSRCLSVEDTKAFHQVSEHFIGPKIKFSRRYGRRRVKQVKKRHSLQHFDSTIAFLRLHTCRRCTSHDARWIGWTRSQNRACTTTEATQNSTTQTGSRLCCIINAIVIQCPR